MNTPSPPPPMSHSAAYYEHQRSPNTSSSAHYYPRPSPLQRPQAAYFNHARHIPPGRRHSANAHANSSISRSTSASSAASELKLYQPEQTYNMGPHVERAHYEDTSRRTSQMDPAWGHGAPRNNEMIEDHSAVIRYLQEHEIEEDEPRENDHAIWILFWLSLLDPFHSLFSCLFSIFTLFGLVILSPFRMCQKDTSFSISLIRTVAPIFRNHLQMICAPSVKDAHTFEFSPAALILVHLFSPLLSFGVAFFSWIAAVFWLFALIMGNPDGTEKRDDGRATVLMIRNWWEKYLLNALRRR